MDPNKGAFFTFYTLTPLHAGSGDSAEIIDLPIQREKHTQYPEVYSSSLKGSLRYFFKCKGGHDTLIKAIFGGEDETSAGGVVFTDAKILFFPVRSSEGVFKWITCPFVIERLKRDLKFIGKENEIKSLTQNIRDENGLSFDGNPDSLILLEDFPITITNGLTDFGLFGKIAAAYEIDEAVVKKRLVIVSDNVFKTLVTTATQVIARNNLDDKTKTSTNLWYEEVVPADAVFYTLMMPAYRPKKTEGNLQQQEVDPDEALVKLAEQIKAEILQLGGNETVGYGFVRLHEIDFQQQNTGGTNAGTTE
jgi:CRISPR-associated protein Cmr4